jgi:hypothetical protein
MVFANKIALVLVIAAALFFGLRDGGKEAVTNDPEALWDSGVERANAMMSEETQVSLTDSLTESVSYAEEVGEDVSDIAE